MDSYEQQGPSAADRSGTGRASWLLSVAFAVGLLLFVGASVFGAAQDRRWWRDNLSGPDSSNFVDADEIGKSNVHRLEVAWTYPYAASDFNPIVVDDVIYTRGRNGTALIALDASTGKEIWIHDGLMGLPSRGINYWQSEDGRDRRLLFPIRSFLQAIDARTGQSILTFGNNGLVDLREGVARAEGRITGVASSSPGKVWRNLLIVGSYAPEPPFPAPPGDIRAFDVVTGKLAWQFHTIPLPGEFGYDTWPKDAYKYVGGANNWGSMSVDEERGIVYVPTASPTYDFYGADRHGANLFGDCLLALDARTGKRLWHFQTIHHDIWDLDNTSAPMLVTVRHNGRSIDAVAQAGKTGFLYVFNRVTGEPLWPIEERPVPKTDVPGEYTHPTQPFPTKPAPFARQSFTIDDVNPSLLTAAEYQTMRARVAKARNGTGPQGGLFVPPAVNEDSVSMPGNLGGSNWGTTAANPTKGLVFVTSVNQVALLKLEDLSIRTTPGGVIGGRGGRAFALHCQSCHGTDLQGARGTMTSLIGVTNRLSDAALRAVITAGRASMPASPNLSQEDMDALVAFLASAGRGGRGRGGRGGQPPAPTLPPGPVIATGGVPLPVLPPETVLSGMSGGHAVYPDGMEPPKNRYVSDLGNMPAHTKPPYSVLTAYDLNTGEIKWQVPTGDHPPTIARGGPTNTGGLDTRSGMVVTKGGLVFQLGGDGKVRAHDEETGKVLWEGLAGVNMSRVAGVPVSYQSRGRQYVVVVTNTSDGGSDGAAQTFQMSQTPGGPPIGMIAFALPRR